MLWRRSCHYIFINILEVSANHNFLSVLEFFTAKICHAHYRIAVIPRTHQTLRFTFCAFFHRSYWYVSFMAAKTTLQFTFATLCWSNNTVAQCTASHCTLERTKHVTSTNGISFCVVLLPLNKTITIASWHVNNHLRMKAWSIHFYH